MFVWFCFAIALVLHGVVSLDEVALSLLFMAINLPYFAQGHVKIYMFWVGW